MDFLETIFHDGIIPYEKIRRPKNPRKIALMLPSVKTMVFPSPITQEQSVLSYYLPYHYLIKELILCSLQ
jgi:hypothetical protein